MRQRASGRRQQRFAEPVQRSLRPYLADEHPALSRRLGPAGGDQLSLQHSADPCQSGSSRLRAAANPQAVDGDAILLQHVHRSLEFLPGEPVGDHTETGVDDQVRLDQIDDIHTGALRRMVLDRQHCHHPLLWIQQLQPRTRGRCPVQLHLQSLSDARLPWWYMHIAADDLVGIAE